jgi:hypothetical protein
MKKITKALFILLILFLLPTICLSDEYHLLEGKNEEVCKVYLKNLNLFPDWPLMACDRSFSEDIPDLKGIDWRPTWRTYPGKRETTINNPDVWDKILAFVDPGLYPTRKKYDFTGYNIREAKIDIDNDGILDTVYRVEIYLCRSSKYYATYLVVFDEKKNEVDMERTKKILGSAIWEGVLGHGVMYDAFTYKGKTYFDMWDDRSFENDPKMLTVYLFVNNKVQKICTNQHKKP